MTEDDMEDISNFPRNLEGVELAVTFRTTENGDTKLSIRATPAYDAAAIALALGGGGHRGAAGATLSATKPRPGKWCWRFGKAGHL